MTPKVLIMMVRCYMVIRDAHHYPAYRDGVYALKAMYSYPHHHDAIMYVPCDVPVMRCYTTPWSGVTHHYM